MLTEVKEKISNFWRSCKFWDKNAAGLTFRSFKKLQKIAKAFKEKEAAVKTQIEIKYAAGVNYQVEPGAKNYIKLLTWITKKKTEQINVYVF